MDIGDYGIPRVVNSNKNLRIIWRVMCINVSSAMITPICFVALRHPVVRYHHPTSPWGWSTDGICNSHHNHRWNYKYNPHPTATEPPRERRHQPRPTGVTIINRMQTRPTPRYPTHTIWRYRPYTWHHLRLPPPLPPQHQPRAVVTMSTGRPM